MKNPLYLAIVLIFFISATPAALSMDGDDLLTTAVRLRLQSVAPIVVDPDIIDLKLLSIPITVDATTRSGALSQLKSELEPRGLTVTDQGSVVWITKRETESDLSRQIAVIINTPNYRQLANLFASESKSNPDLRIQRLAEMASFMAEQSLIPAQTMALIDAKSEAIKNLQFMQRNALSGSSLSAPDPARAGAIELDIEKQRQEVLEYYDKLIGKLLASKFNPEDPSTAPPAIFAVQDLLPSVLFNRIALDSELFYVQGEEALLRASSDLAFRKADMKDTALLRARVDEINKAKIVMQSRLSKYMSLLQQAGLVPAQDARVTSTRSSQLGVEAANQLFNLYGDRREAVRVAIGRGIIEQFEHLAKQVRKGGEGLLRHTDTRELFLLGENELRAARESLASEGASMSAYSPRGAERIGAITGLVGGDAGGATYVLTVDLEVLEQAKITPERSLQNLFGGSEKVVSFNTAADAAYVDGMLFEKSGTTASDLSQLLGSGGMIGSIADALELIRQKYDPSIFRSRIVIGVDQNYDVSVGGDSGGVAIALAALSRIRSQPVDGRLMVTGAVRQFGEVRPVGSIYEKGVAALDAGALALLMPLSNLGGILSLPTEKIISRNVFSLSRFDEAAALAGLDVGEKSRATLEAVCLHNFAVMAAMGGRYPEALVLGDKAVSVSPGHISAQVLRSILRAAAVKPVDSDSLVKLFERSSAFANVLSTNPIAASEKSTTTATAQPGSILGAIIPDFTVTGASGDEAFDALNNKARAAFGQPANITIRSKNEYFTTKFMNLSIKNKTVSEILQQICDLCDAKFQQKGSAIVVDSIRPAVAAELSSIVIPDFAVQDKSAQEAFKHLADKAAEISGKPVNIVIDSKNNLFRTLSINLSLQRKTFKEILDQLCLICDATSEQRGDAFIVTTPN